MKTFYLLMLLSVNFGLLSSCSTKNAISETFSEFKDCDECPSMIRLPSGTYTMGDLSDTGRENERPATEVTIEKSFAISKYVITVGDFRRFVNETHYKTEAEVSKGCWNVREDSSIGWVLTDFWDNTRMNQADTHPVVCVSINDALAYTRWLSNKSSAHYRLPTEVEWEYAARAGTQTKYIFGDAPGNVCKYVNWSDDNMTLLWGGGEELMICNDNFLYTSPVGSFSANNFGLYDMYGNVWEWVVDCYEPNLSRSITQKSKVQKEECAKHPLRGASYTASLKGTTTTYRINGKPDIRTADYGFRIVREIDL